MYSFLLSQERRLDSCFRRSDSFSDFYESLIPDFAQKLGPDRQTKKLPWIALKSYCFGNFLHPFDRILNQFIQSNFQHLGPFFDD